MFFLPLFLLLSGLLRVSEILALSMSHAIVAAIGCDSRYPALSLPLCAIRRQLFGAELWKKKGMKRAALAHRTHHYRQPCTTRNMAQRIGPLPAEVICKTYTKTAEGGVLTKTLSRLRTKDSGDPIPPPPDGGIKAWSQALLCHLVLFKYSCHTFRTTLTLTFQQHVGFY